MLVHYLVTSMSLCERPMKSETLVGTQEYILKEDRLFRYQTTSVRRQARNVADHAHGRGTANTTSSTW